jgi:hypothetical protein
MEAPVLSKITIASKDYEPKEVVAIARRSPDTFLWIGGMSLANTLLLHLQASLSFPVGLGTTLLVDAFASTFAGELEGVPAMLVLALGFCIDAVAIGSTILVWRLARRGSALAFAIGGVLYALDALISLAFSDWIGLAFHGYFLFLLLGGWHFVRMRKQAEESLAAPAQVPESWAAAA